MQEPSSDPVVAAFSWHLSLRADALAAAFNFLAAHSFASLVPSSAPAGDPVRSPTTSSTKVSILVPIASASPVTAQPAASSASVNLRRNRSSTRDAHAAYPPGLTISLDQHLSWPVVRLPEALSLRSTH